MSIYTQKQKLKQVWFQLEQFHNPKPTHNSRFGSWETYNNRNFTVNERLARELTDLYCDVAEANYNKKCSSQFKSEVFTSYCNFLRGYDVEPNKYIDSGILSHQITLIQKRITIKQLQTQI